MSFTYRLSFDPIAGEFKMIKIPVVTVAGGATITAGVLTLPSGTEMECQLEITVTGPGSLTVDPGSTLLVV